MHELAIAQSLMTAIGTWREQHGSPAILAAKIELGPLAGVDPELLRYAWKTACETCSEVFRHCRLDIEERPLRYHCDICGHDFESKILTSRCPACSGESPVRSGGRELNLLSIEVE